MKKYISFCAVDLGAVDTGNTKSQSGKGKFGFIDNSQIGKEDSKLENLGNDNLSESLNPFLTLMGVANRHLELPLALVPFVPFNPFNPDTGAAT
ncbi:hypothetical protein ACFLZV_01165 [Candidatus Margulisiibacteriota bacterium]